MHTNTPSIAPSGYQPSISRLLRHHQSEDLMRGRMELSPVRLKNNGFGVLLAGDE
jgi:hypothetical protein